LLQHTSHPDKVVIVNKVCDDVGLAFKLWDGAFSAIHSPNPTVEHCTVTQTRIDNAMGAHIRGMGFSVTPKMHGMESHLVRQMRTTPGGIGMLVEHWIEQYHQIGFWFDMAIVKLDLSWDKQQFDQVWKREDATHESNYAKSYWKKDLLEYEKKDRRSRVKKRKYN
jgi:hypothetical protein